ncbi:MAG TPA: RagB/SusD family nutrient uptake outer membrane protein [Mucilaginibacter sp.]
MNRKDKLFKLKLFGWIVIILLQQAASCTKIISIDPPTSTITTTQVFADSADATSALMGLYTSASSTGSSLFIDDGALSIYTGSSADELIDFNQIDPNYLYTNSITPQNSIIESYFWTPAYNVIYNANACIEGVESSNSIPSSIVNQIIGEAKFMRALTYFNLVNLFGDVPLVLTTSYKTNSLLPRQPVSEIYKSIISDLTDAQKLLLADYSISGNQKIRANKWAATALLARVYLYQNKFDSAELEATAILNNGSLFGLVRNLDSTFLKNNKEAILQWNLNTTIFPYNLTAEGFSLIPYSGSYPYYYLSPQLLSSFEIGDQRKVHWIDSTNYQGTEYYLPYKYKLGPPDLSVGGPATEYYTVLRLAEQYLIRAEARLKSNGNLSGAIDDVNQIRLRAGLPALSYTLSASDILAKIMQERRIEYFAEWGHRWFDLKRTGAIDSVMSKVTPTKIGGGAWLSTQQLYPIPQSELLLNPNLTQNSGY